VNYAVESSELITDKDARKLILRLQINTEICAVIDYFEIFMERMLLCRKAADYFKLHFALEINGQEIM
jgi:hypothetical protein